MRPHRICQAMAKLDWAAPPGTIAPEHIDYLNNRGAIHRVFMSMDPMKHEDVVCSLYDQQGGNEDRGATMFSDDWVLIARATNEQWCRAILTASEMWENEYPQL